MLQCEKGGNTGDRRAATNAVAPTRTGCRERATATRSGADEVQEENEPAPPIRRGAPTEGVQVGLPCGQRTGHRRRWPAPRWRGRASWWRATPACLCTAHGNGHSPRQASRGHPRQHPTDRTHPPLQAHGRDRRDRGARHGPLPHPIHGRSSPPLPPRTSGWAAEPAARWRASGAWNQSVAATGLTLGMPGQAEA